MSIAVMNWAWTVNIKPAPKLVLMALADIADDAGICWPSVPTIARKCSVDQRTAQRLISFLKRRGLVRVECRFRDDGSRTSNRYRILFATLGDKIPPPCGKVDAPLVAENASARDSTATQTTSNPQTESPPQHAGSISSGGDSLIYPNTLQPREVAAIRKQLLALTPNVAQQILDELAGRMKISEVRNLIRYCASLVHTVNEGTFAPELGLRIAEARIRQAMIKRKSREAAANVPSPPKFDTLPSALRDKLTRIQEQQRTRAEAVPTIANDDEE